MSGRKTVSLSDILIGIARECADLANASDAVQDVIGQLMAANTAPLDARTLHDVQAADRNSQVLRRLSTLSSLLSQHAPDEIVLPRGDLAHAVVLDSLLLRLLDEHDPGKDDCAAPLSNFPPHADGDPAEKGSLRPTMTGHEPGQTADLPPASGRGAP